MTILLFYIPQTYYF